MKCASPVIIGLEPYENTLNGPNNECIPLPCLRSPDGRVVSRWEPSPGEIEQINSGASVFLCIWTAGNPYPPSSVYVAFKNEGVKEMCENLRCEEFMELRMMGEEIHRKQHELEELINGYNQRSGEIITAMQPKKENPEAP